MQVIISIPTKIIPCGRWTKHKAKNLIVLKVYYISLKTYNSPYVEM